ncbi:tetratricopeptide repeat protein [Aquimarina spinulae]|nr:tetratricopeptide repeat protein [Aquimarina spinulae]
MLPFTLKSQIREETYTPVYKKITLEEKEKKSLEEVYKLLADNQDNKAYQKATNLSKSVKINYSKVKVNLLLSKYFYKKSLTDSSIYFAKRALKLNHILNDSIKNRTNGLIYELLGANYIIKGLYLESKKYHLKGIEVTQKYDEKEFYYSHLHNLATSYMMLGDNQTALRLFKQCLEYKEDEILTSLTYSNIGDIYSNLKDYKTSNYYLEKSKNLSKKTGDTYNYAATLISLGVNYQKQGHHNEAISFYNEAITISEKNGYDYITLSSKFDSGVSFIKLKEYDKATALFLNVISEAEKLGILEEQMSSYEMLKQISLTQGKYKDSYNYLNKEIKIKDSIHKLQKSKAINELEVKFNTLQKEKEIKVLQVKNANRELDLKNQEEAIKNLKLQQEIEKKETQNKILSFQNASEKKRNEIIVLKKDQEIHESKLARQKSIKNSILYSFLILLIPVIGLLFTYYQKLQTQNELNKKQEEVSEQKISSLIKDQELKLIKASIKGQDKERKRIAQELHDSIGGNLAAIKLQLNNTVFHGDKKTISTINNQLDDTYDQVRNLSHNLIPKKFSENNFCDVLEEYFNNIGGTTSLSTSFVAYPRAEIDILDETLQIEVFKIIQELITNTIKHAKATSLELQLNLVENMINVLFEDNGIGFNTKNKATGLGFESIKNRLKKVSGTFHIDSRVNRGTIIDIEVPVFTLINDKGIL